MLLEVQQKAVMQALDYGPEYLPQGIFAGVAERVLLGLKVHANTISHARLVALEDTFPRTRRILGEASFNRLSRAYLELPQVPGLALADIGRDFAPFLQTRADTAASGDLAYFEWHWLQAYHAADAKPLALEDLGGLAPEALLDLRIVCHPSAWAGQLAASAWAVLLEELPGLESAEGVLLTRPDVDVLVTPCTPAQAALLGVFGMARTVRHVFEQEEASGRDAGAVLPSVIALIRAGALVQAGKGDCLQ